MCTVVFLPKGDQFYFASLRDENPLRPNAVAPRIYEKEDTMILSPIDAMAGGTWLGVTAAGNVIILLNGGFTKHTGQPNYQKSRGLIVAELLTAAAPVMSWKSMNMQGIEPYTLVVWNAGNLFQLVWDGEQKYCLVLKPGQPYIFSSATLYDDAARNYRHELFQQWIKMNMPVSSSSLFDFFTSFTDRVNGFLMNRNEQTKTLSYTFIKLKINEAAEMEYHDFLSETICTNKIWFNNNSINLCSQNSCLV